MVTFADNDTVLTADEGEPREGYGDGIADPRGSVTVVDVSALTSEVVGFDAFDGRRDELAASGVVLKKGVIPPPTWSRSTSPSPAARPISPCRRTTPSPCWI